MLCLLFFYNIHNYPYDNLLGLFLYNQVIYIYYKDIIPLNKERDIYLYKLYQDIYEGKIKPKKNIEKNDNYSDSKIYLKDFNDENDIYVFKIYFLY